MVTCKKKCSRLDRNKTAAENKFVNSLVGNLHIYSITWFKRFQEGFVKIFTILLVSLTVYGAICVFDRAEFTPIKHKVRSGETLWSIARDSQPDCVSFQEYWTWVCEHNNGADIKPGDIVIMAEVKE